jgi:hypothetical protein
MLKFRPIPGGPGFQLTSALGAELKDFKKISKEYKVT